MKDTRALRDYKRTAKRAGAEVVKCKRNGHYQLTLRFAGHEKMFSVAATASDLRGRLNYEAQVKRWIRELREQGTSDPQSAPTRPGQHLPLFS
jgi:hypothetical protein